MKKGVVDSRKTVFVKRKGGKAKKARVQRINPEVNMLGKENNIYLQYTKD